MAINLRSLAVAPACLALLSLGGPLFLSSTAYGDDPVTGEQLFEKQWQWNSSAEAFSETDFNVKIPNEILVGLQDAAGAAALLREALDRDPRLGAEVNFGRQPGGDGLGPLHNATSCAACHDRGGGSGVRHNVTMVTVDPRSDFFKRIGPDSGKMIMDFFPGLLNAGGGMSFNTVVHDASTRPGYDTIRDRLGRYVPGEIDQAWFNPRRRTAEAISKQPVVAGRYRTLDYYLSQRNSPALFGLGQINSVSTARLNHVATKQATLTQGAVTGRVAGKFGWRGQVQSLSQFVSGACAGELGLNQGPTASQANDPADPEYISPKQDISPVEVAKLTSFVASLPQPIEVIPEGHTRKTVRSGEKIFNSIGCAICHVPDMPPVSNLFSDLLLHDMGAELQAPFPAPVGQLQSIGLVDPVQVSSEQSRRVVSASGYYGTVLQTRPPLPYPFPQPEQPQFPRGELSAAELAGSASMTWDAMQREWKTPPLWGVADSAPYLHDGRAETLQQAIEWHGGEASASREKYARLEREQQEKLIVFLSSLRSPTELP